MSDQVKNPALVKLLEERKAQRNAVLEKTKPLEARRDELLQQITPLQREWEQLGQKIAALEQGGNMRDVCQDIAALTRALSPNHRGVKAEAGGYGMKRKEQ